MQDVSQMEEEGGASVDQEVVETVQECEVPNNIPEVQSLDKQEEQVLTSGNSNESRQEQQIMMQDEDDNRLQNEGKNDEVVMEDEPGKNDETMDDLYEGFEAVPVPPPPVPPHVRPPRRDHKMEVDKASVDDALQRGQDRGKQQRDSTPQKDLSSDTHEELRRVSKSYRIKKRKTSGKRARR
eukprot:TRINITY_DN8100_c0_g1_i12.p1 TRINITY_DN8100_c0_g1~~TRINITY_DN8100_c0_g1_i12.p1  ORF type:complete len:182 (-),score=31.28 TRINITY_DN8100_c0_g1_i12:165-710(-)